MRARVVIFGSLGLLTLALTWFTWMPERFASAVLLGFGLHWLIVGTEHIPAQLIQKAIMHFDRVHASEKKRKNSFGLATLVPPPQWSIDCCGSMRAT